MVGRSKHIAAIWLVLILILIELGYAQTKPASIWATARFNKEQVMVGEPLVVTVTVYTSTWFTQPPVFSEIRLFTRLFDDCQPKSPQMYFHCGRERERKGFFTNIVQQKAFSVRVQWSYS